jgi:hypothetical protein
VGRVIRAGTYCGPIAELEGETAILLDTANHCLMEDDESPCCLAQFDNRDLVLNEEHMGYGWRRFLREDFCDLWITETL